MRKPFHTQPALFVSAAEPDHPTLRAPDDAESLPDPSEIERLLLSIHASRTGRPGYPLPTSFRGLLPGVRYGLSDVRPSQCPYRDLPFRRFRRLGLGGGVPDATTLGRFRSHLAGHDLWELLLGEVNRRLEERHIVMTGGRINIVDATPVEAARSGRGRRKDGAPARDPEAGLHVGKDGRGRMKGICGHSVHTGVDGDGFVHRRTVTPGNVHDGRERDRLPLGDGTAFHADAAYGSRGTRDKPARFGIADQVQRKGRRGHPLSAADKERNAGIAVVRSGVERVFAVYKQCCGLGRTRFPGLARNTTFHGLAAVAPDIRKGALFLRLHGLPRPAVEG